MSHSALALEGIDHFRYSYGPRDLGLHTHSLFFFKYGLARLHNTGRAFLTEAYQPLSQSHTTTDGTFT
jgi:hypothetical protein